MYHRGLGVVLVLIAYVESGKIHKSSLCDTDDRL